MLLTYVYLPIVYDFLGEGKEKLTQVFSLLSPAGLLSLTQPTPSPSSPSKQPSMEEQPTWMLEPSTDLMKSESILF